MLILLAALLLGLAARPLLCPARAAPAAAGAPQWHDSAEAARKENLFLEAAEAARSPAGEEPGQLALPEVSGSLWWGGFDPHLSPGEAATPWATPRKASP